MALRGKKLDEAIRQECEMMVREGFNHSPISNKTVYDRLVEKGVIAGKLSTLSTRKEMIAEFAKQQQEAVGGSYGKSLKDNNNKSRSDLIKRNAELRDEIEHTKAQLRENTDALINIVKIIESENLAQNIERALSPYLIRELRKTEDKS